MAIQDRELLATFVEECREHLGSIENDVLAIEAAGASADQELINRVFRAAHSIKGGAGFFDLRTIKDLAHKLENLLDLLRSGRLVPNPEITNALLTGFDRLGELVADIENANQYDVSLHIQGLNDLVASYLEPDQKQSVRTITTIPVPGASRPFEVEEFTLAQNLSQGRSVYLIRMDMIDDIHRKGRTPLEALSVLEGAGIVLDCALDLAAMGDLTQAGLPESMPFFILYASADDAPVVARLLDISPGAFTLMMLAETVLTKNAETEKPDRKGKGKAAGEVMASEAQSGKPDMAVQPSKSRAAAEPEGTAQPRAAAEPEGTAQPKGTATPLPARQPQPESPKSESDATIRIQLHLLDSLMNYAGELVLARNQLLDALKRGQLSIIQQAGQRIHLVTGDLQEAVMRTRLQPASILFDRFPRLVRDLSRDLGKDIHLELSGKEVEFDKTIIEGLADPLTHLVRNACDHGIETPAIRHAAGKTAEGRLSISAAHEAGQVVVEIADDGAGIDPEKVLRVAMAKGLVDRDAAARMSDREKAALIMLPGFSTAEAVTDLSGRGVGMDVVKTNVERLGGRIDVESVAGSGTVVRLKLPLTLAIIPALLVSARDERFAIPQIEVAELIRVRASEARNRIERMGDQDVLVLRGEVLPLIRLADVLGMEPAYRHPESGAFLTDRRQRLSDRRGDVAIVANSTKAGSAVARPKDDPAERSGADRRYHASSDLEIVILSVGSMRYGLVVDALHDTVEIVVKPLGRQLKAVKEYAGATILGDGTVALILDPTGLATRCRLTEARKSGISRTKTVDATQDDDLAAYVSFANSATERCAVPIDQVERVELVRAADIELIGTNRVVRRDGQVIPVLQLCETAKVTPVPDAAEYVVTFATVASRRFGLLGLPPVDTVQTAARIDTSMFDQTGISGTIIHGDRTSLVVDMDSFILAARPDLFQSAPSATANKSSRAGAGGSGSPTTQNDPDWTATTGRTASGGYASNAPTRAPDNTPTSATANTTINGQTPAPLIVLAEDSAFFRERISAILSEAGYRVVACVDGEEAWAVLKTRAAEVDVLVSDVEMPRLDGIGLARRVRADAGLADLPIIAVTSLASEDDTERGRAAGISEYLVKLDRDRLLASLDALNLQAQGQRSKP
jgi:two-component system chemotaxis sensor kinase CheA